VSLTLSEPAAPTFGAEEVTHPPPLLVTADDIAEVLRISRRTVYRLRARGDLPPPVELSRHVVRWRWIDVCDYLARLKTRSAARPPAANSLRRKAVRA